MNKIFSLDNIFIFLFLAIFPLGQIVRIGILQPIDLIVGMAAVYSVFRKQKVPEFVKQLKAFLFFAAVSWILSIFIFHQIEVLYGLLYMVRLVAFFYFGIYVWNFVKKKVENKKLVLDSLLSISIISSLFGWIQFFKFPDLKPFFVWGWDMHLYRLVGTFLDPTFLGLIIVFGLIITIYRYIVMKDQKYLLAALFLLVSLAFTYSRASYLAFLGGIGYLLYMKKKIGYILYPISILGALIFMLPTERNHSIEFFRSFTTIAKINNYQETIQIIKKFPAFGVGFDNLCLARKKFIGPESYLSHSCSGSDSSILFVLATTGVVGFIVFVRSQIAILRYTKYNILYTSSFIALLIHSLFSNSMFYPWVMGWIIVLLCIQESLAKSKQG